MTAWSAEFGREHVTVSRAIKKAMEQGRETVDGPLVFVNDRTCVTRSRASQLAREDNSRTLGRWLRRFSYACSTA